MTEIDKYTSIFNGTPDQFHAVVSDIAINNGFQFSPNYYRSSGSTWGNVRSNEYHAGITLKDYEIGACVTIEAEAKSDGKTRMYVLLHYGELITFEDQVETIFRQLIAERWIGSGNVLPHEVKDEPTPREAHQIAATAAHYGHTKCKALQDVAATLMGTTDRTYRKYLKLGWLLTDAEFVRLTGKTIHDYWIDKGGD